MAAEGRRQRERAGQPGRFNGAAAGWPRKDYDHSRPTAQGARLQWGRGRMAAEGGRGARREREPVASMGPRPDGRGRRRAASRPAASLTLQWGRGRMAAEGRALAIFGVAPLELQWGRGRMAAEGFACMCTLTPPTKLQWGRGRMAAEGLSARTNPRCRRASMGPRPDGRGRARAVQGMPIGGARFNGAAAGWPRKADLRTEAPAEESLQWGRGRMAAEG